MSNELDHEAKTTTTTTKHSQFNVCEINGARRACMGQSGRWLWPNKSKREGRKGGKEAKREAVGAQTGMG